MGLAVGLAAGAGFGVAWNIKSQPTAAAVKMAQFPLLARRIFIDQPNDTIINFIPLRKAIADRFSKVEGKKSFYFEYLPDGTSIRNGADDNLVAASLLKVPMVMNLYRAAELGRVKLDDKITVTEAEIDQNYGDLWRKGAGYTLTYRQAAAYALEDSDNTATRAIYDNVKDLLKPDEQSLARLDIDQNAESGQAVVNARSYTSVLKGLYFSAYLSKEHSAEILEHLANSRETNRITKFLPDTLTVAHKNGVYNASSWAQSDCGIVYAPRRPYMLCVMVELPTEQADALISEVSKEVYDFVISQ